MTYGSGGDHESVIFNKLTDDSYIKSSLALNLRKSLMIASHIYIHSSSYHVLLQLNH